MIVKMLTRYASPKRSCPPGGSIDLPKKEAQSLIDGGYAVEKKSPAAPAKTPQREKSPEQRFSEILNAVSMIIEENDESKLIASGAPKVEALQDLVGFDVTSEERDSVFEQVT